MTRFPPEQNREMLTMPWWVVVAALWLAVNVLAVLAGLLRAHNRTRHERSGRGKERAMERCDPEIFAHGESIAAVDGRSEAVERWVQALARAADARLDWHYSGGVANVLHMGDAESRARVERAIDASAGTLDGRILRRYTAGEHGLYRVGVDPVPGGALGVALNPLTGEQEPL